MVKEMNIWQIFADYAKCHLKNKLTALSVKRNISQKLIFNLIALLLTMRREALEKQEDQLN